MASQEGPERPSTFGETPEQRTELQASEDYSLTPEGDSPEEYGWPDEEIRPIPVFLTEVPPDSREMVRWSSQRFTVKDEPVMIAGDNLNRKSISIVNHSANPLFVTPEQSNATAFFGKIAAGASLNLTCNTRVYALLTAGLTAEVSVFQEYVIDEDN